MLNDLSLNEYPSRIKVVGVGNQGCQALNYLIRKEIQNVHTIAVDTDVQMLLQSLAHERILIGDGLTYGQGTRGNKDLGKMAAEESCSELEKILNGAGVVFIMAGFGGGTGSGAASVISSIAKKIGALTIGIVTLPFQFEGKSRIQVAEIAVQKFEKNIDTLINVSVEQLFGNRMLFSDGVFAVLSTESNILLERFNQSVTGVSDLLSTPGLINLDLVDVRQIMAGGVFATVAFGLSAGGDRARIAAENALANQTGYLNLENARGVLFNITGGANMTLFEVNQVARIIRNATHPDVNMIFGAIVDPKMGDNLQVTIVATGNKARILDATHDSEFGILTPPRFMLDEKPLPSTRRLRVFLCHSSGDKPVVRKLFQRLFSRKGIDPWLDEAKLLPGEAWNYEIEKAVSETDVVIVCLSHSSVSKEGYVQTEIKRALDIADEKPDGTIFIIPLRLEDCAVPKRLSNWQWVNYYEDGAFNKLMKSLRKRADTLSIVIE